MKLMNLMNSILLMAAIMVGSSYHMAAAAADTDNLQVSPGFRYEMSRSLSVDIALALPDSNPALISFYSQGANGLRLLENVFTSSQGDYSGQLRLPAHLTQVVMVVRGTERQETLTVPVSADAITYVE